MPPGQHNQWPLGGIVNKATDAQGTGRPRQTPSLRQQWCSQPVAYGWALATKAFASKVHRKQNHDTKMAWAMVPLDATTVKKCRRFAAKRWILRA